ncbi:MAG: FAD-binding domain-containing protein, partial [Burkholderiaceae bacterium]
ANFTTKEIHAPWLVSSARQKEAGCIIGRDYPTPIVDHATARKATLKRFGAVRV